MFYSCPEDKLPPSVTVNKGLVLDENSVKKITTLQLSSTDQDSEPGELVYRITKQTQLGHLELSTNPGMDTNPHPVAVDSLDTLSLRMFCFYY